MPGANVPGRAADTFFKQYYLDAFDAIIIFQAGGLDATTYTLAKELDKAGVPYFFVRNKMDNDVYEHKTDEANQGRLCTWSRAEADMRRTLGQQHRESAKNAGLSAVPPLYFLCSRMASSSSPHPFGPTSFDAGKLMADLAAKLDQASA